jgi:hypothetical protein
MTDINVKMPNTAGQLHRTYQGLVFLNTVLIQKLGGINFWMVVTVKWGVGLRWRVLIEHSLVRFNHLFNVTLRGDAKVVAIISAKSHTKMVINRSSTFQFEPVLFSKHICNHLGFLTRDAELIYIDSNVLVEVINSMHPNVWFSLTGFKTHLPETLRKSLMPA